MANDKNQMEQLLQKSCSLLERNYLGQTALHFAVIRPKLLAYLVARFDNLDVDMPDRHGTTPLMYAATYGEDESVITLLRAGANLWKRNDLNHRNFLDFALGREKWNVLYRTIQDYDDIDNILDEQSIEIQELDESLETLATDERPDYTEAWIQELAQYVTEYKAPASGAQDFDTVDFLAQRYVVDTERDEFRSKMVVFGPDWRTADMRRRVNIQAYLDWVAYCYDHRAGFAQCAGIDEDWRKRRIRSALRLRQVLAERRLEGGNGVEQC
ncbi:hypothetical protein LTS15_003180 [Exophiala xenobiotica]|nr:hypothetical protein LTS15_003180 [Exophiala xenobiotica]